MRGTCAAASAVLTVTRTISEPARASSTTWVAVPWRSAVSVLVIDCTKTGAPPPISACPTRTCRVLCLEIFVIGRSIQRQSRDLDLDVGFQIDGLVVVDEAHGRPAADHEGQRAPPDDDPAAPGGVQLRHQRLAVPVPDLDPGFAVELEANPPFGSTAARGLLRLWGGSLRRRRRRWSRWNRRFRTRRGGLYRGRRLGFLLRGRRIRRESRPWGSPRAPLVEYAGHDDEGEDRESQVGSGAALAAMYERDALVAQIEVYLPGHIALFELNEQGLRVRLEQLGVAAHHPADERRSRQLVELLGFERLDLARAVLEPLRYVRDRELALGAQLSEHPPGSGPGGRHTGFSRLVHSNRPFCSSWYP